MIFKKNSGSVSKTFLTSLVIFNLVFTTAATPVVSLAFEGETPATQTEDSGDSKIEKDTKGDGGDKQDPSDDDGRVNPGKEDPNSEKEGPAKEDTSEESSSSSGSTKGGSTDRGVKGEVKGDETASCDVGNLITNGSFENPNVSNSDDWDIFPGSISGWTAEWNGSFDGAPETANVEIHSGVMGWNAYVGGQYTELDSDWGGPTDPAYGEAASAIISQTIDTVPGNKYLLHFAFAARPGTTGDDNKLGIYIDDGEFDLSTTSSGEGLTSPYWIVREYEFTAYNSETKISFADLGTPNSMGTFLDDVRVNCADEGDSCPANNMIYARIKLSPQPYGWRNWGNGNTSGRIYVGGSDASDAVVANEWFPLTNADGSFINDADIATYRDVPGLALERKEGSVRIVLYGFLYDEVKPTTDGPKNDDGRVELPAVAVAADQAGTPQVRNYYMMNRELAQLSLEFTTGAEFPARSSVVVPLSQMSDPANPMDHTPNVHQYHPGSDNFRIKSNLSQAHMLVTTGSDGFYTYYSKTTSGNGGKDCPTDDEKTGSLVVNKTIQGVGNGTFHFSGPTGSFNITTSNGEGAYTITDLEEGTYTVTENTEAGWDVVSSTCMNVVVTEDNVSECTIVNMIDDGNPGCEGNDCPTDGACESGAIYARINVEDFLNLGSGDVTSDIYLGSASNVVASGEWFMVYDGANYINDAEISGYEDVKGLAVQRMNGKLRVVLHGSSTPNPTHKEYVQGNIDFFNGLVTQVTEDSSGNNNLEDGTDGAFDYISFAGDHAYFEIQVDEADDGFFTKYVYSLDEDCDDDNGGDEDPGIDVTDTCVLYGTDFPMNAITITNNQDGTYTHSNIFIFDLNTFHSDIPGVYPLTITLKDDEGNVVVPGQIYNFTVAPEGAEDCDNGGDGGGDDDNPVLVIPGDACYAVNFEGFNVLDGVSATDFAGDAIILVEGENLVVVGTPDFTIDGSSFDLTYTVTDPFGSDTETRHISVSSDCDGGNGGNGDGGGNGGGNGGNSSSSGGGSRNRGEVLGAETGACVAFAEYHDTGDQGGEIHALQMFLNEYMGTNLVVDGIYDHATTQAVHDFQALHWDDIIDPWTPPLSPNTTGREYKTTRATINAIINCPELPVYLEDPMTMFSITEVKNKKAFTESQIDKVTELLLEAQSAATAASAVPLGK